MSNRSLITGWVDALVNGERLHLFDTDIIVLAPFADDTGSIYIGDSTRQMDFRIYTSATKYMEFNAGTGDITFSGSPTVDFTGVAVSGLTISELMVGDAKVITFGDGDDITMGWTGTVFDILPVADDTGIINIGNGTTDIDVKIFLGAATDYVEFNVGDGQVNIENAELHLGDTDKLEFGDGDDVTVAWSGTALDILPVANDTGAINVGNGTNNIDLKAFLGAATDYIEFNVGEGQVNIEGAELHLGDTDALEFGDGNDVTVAWSGTALNVLPATDDVGAINVGNGTADMDVKIFLGAVTDYAEFDIGNGQVNIEGAELHFGDTDKLEFGDGDDVTVAWSGTALDILPVANDTGAVNIGNGTNNIDLKVFLGATTDYVEFNVGDGQLNIENAELHLGDTDKIEFGDGNDVTIAWSSTALDILPAADDTGAINIGNGTVDLDLKVFLGAATDYVEFNVGDGQLNIENAELHFGDTDKIEFGDGNDVTIAWSSTALDILPVADDTGAINIGNGTADIDFKVFLGAATDYVEFNVGDGQLNIEGAELHFGDNDKVEFGDGNDITVGWDGTDLDVLAAADDSVIKFGDGTNSTDLWVYGNIPTAYLEWDASASQLRSQGPVRIDLNSLPLRYSLRWVAGEQRKPGIAADATSATIALHEAASKEFEVQGTNGVSTGTSVATGGGIALTTGALIGDQLILAPHTNARTAWQTALWVTNAQVEWEADIISGANITDTTIWLGLKLTNTSVTATDDNQVFFRYQDTINTGKWQAIDSIAGVDTATDTGVTVAVSTRYHLKITIDSSRVARFYINGVLVKTSGVLTDAINLKPWVGVETGAVATKTMTIYGQAISRVPA